MGRLHTFVVSLRRESRELSWGLRLVGGADLATPLIVTRVTPGTPAGKELIRGDIIAKIDDYDARDLRHEDAQNLFRNAGNQIRIVVQRGSSNVNLYSHKDAEGSYVSRCSTPTFKHDLMPYTHPRYMEVDREAQVSPRPPAPYIPLPASSPSYRTPSPLPSSAPWKTGSDTLLKHSSPSYAPAHGGQGAQGQYEGDYRGYVLSPTWSRATDDTTDESLSSQPYRTTPLVLPGAKVRREPGPTESYLRHHPNPAMRAPPHHDRDLLMKQRVAESVLQRVVGEEAGSKVVHKQFNSPINLYSDSNIANSIRQNQGPVPANGHYGRPHIMKRHKTTVLYDPAKSETFKALQEEGLGDIVQEVPTPVQTKVFTAPPNKRPVPPPKPAKPEVAKTTFKQTTFVNSLAEESIQQSNSFKRLMYNVLGDREF